MVDISVIVATHNRAAFLEPCLESLCQQKLSPEKYEICVVNNASTDTSAAVVEEMAARYKGHNLFMVEEKIAGLSRARNRGIAATSAPLIANMDDDATADAYWLESFLSCFENLPQDVGIVGGEVDPVWQAPPPPWLDAWMKGLLSAASNLGSKPRFLEAHENVLECNCCYRRKAIESVGGYPLSLGRIGDLLLSGEGAAHELMRRKNMRLYFEPSALIHHTIHADRLSLAWLHQRLFWQGISDYAVHVFFKKHGLATIDQINLNLPLSKDDWDLSKTGNVHDRLLHFQNLGFTLAMTGLIDIDEKMN